MLCPTCGDSAAPRPSGTQTFTFAGVTHHAAECAAIASVDETPIRTANGYAAKSGLAICMACFPYGEQHTYTAGTDPHPDPNDPRRRHDVGEPYRRP